MGVEQCNSKTSVYRRWRVRLKGHRDQVPVPMVVRPTSSSRVREGSLSRQSVNVVRPVVVDDPDRILLASVGAHLRELTVFTSCKTRKIVQTTRESIDIMV